MEMNRPMIKTVHVECKQERVSSCMEPLLISYKLIFDVQIGNVVVPVTLEQTNFADLERIVCDTAAKILNEQISEQIKNNN
jgi:hypothetical protein